MGYLQAREMANSGLPLRAQLFWHLTINSYPPVPAYMVDVAIRAIDLANAGEREGMVELPAGVTFRDGRSAIEAWQVVESLHLDAWIQDNDGWED